MEKNWSLVMKNTQLLSVVLSLIMVFGVTAGSAYAQTDDVDDTSIEDEIEEIETEMEDEIEDATDDKTDYETDRDHDRDEDHDRNIDGIFREKLSQWCEMSEEEKSRIATEYGKTEDQVAKSNNYCTLDESDRVEFIAEHREEFRVHSDSMKDKTMDKSHMNYDRICSLSESDRAAEIVDAEKLERISKWCEMTPEERDDYKKEHHDKEGKDHDKMDKVRDGMKMSDMSPRLKEMIMTKHDISDEKREEIKMKYIEKHGELTDERKSELKMKFKEHMASKRVNISDDRKSEIQDRIAEMKVFKAELRERASGMTDEEKQELREEFLENAKDMQLAWISPRHQMNVGVSADEIECREGFSLVMKASNGVPMCLKATTALKMIEKGIAVPAN